MNAPAVCAYCGESFGGTAAYDRHLLVRRMTVITPKGHVVPSEEVVTCRPVGSFGQLMRNGEPRLVRSSKGWWVTKLRTPESLQAFTRSP
jgi:hypothetical protein